MKFNTSLISAAAVLSHCILADYYDDQYYNDDDAQDYLGQYNVNVPKAEDYAVDHDHGVKRCPITGKVLSNLYDDDEEAEGEEKVHRCPITGKIIKHVSEDDEEEDAAEEEDEEEVHRCPITGKIIKKEEKEAGHIGICPITGKPIHVSHLKPVTEEPEAEPVEEVYKHVDPIHHEDPSQNYVESGYYDEPAYHQGGRLQRGNVKSPRAVKKAHMKELEGHKHTPGQTDHTPKPHAHTHDWRHYDPKRYDYDPYERCKFPKDTLKCDTPEYQAQSAVCKEEQLWQNVLLDETRELFFRGPQFQSLFDQDMNHSYDSITDSMPEKRVKVTHPVGVMTKVEYISHPDSPYTGIFRGAQHGLMRISDTVATTPEVAKTVPGHGVKWFRDGMSSANWVAMFSFDGHKSFNFFKNRWTTILRESNNKCARETIMKHLSTVTDHVGATSVMEVAEFDQYGVKEEYPHWPYELNIEPYDVYGWTDEYQNDFQDQMSVIPMDTAMFKVFAFDEPPELGGKEKLIGWIVSRSDTISSHWGDQQLFFNHRRMDDDIKVRPHYFDWLQFWDLGQFFDTELLNPAPQQKCPFFFLFEGAGLI